MTMKYVITPQGANIWANGKVFTVPSSHPRWNTLKLAFKDKNETLVSWVLGESESNLAASAAAADPRLVPFGSWLAWQASPDDLPTLLPASWRVPVEAWVTETYCLIPFSRMLAQCTPAQWEYLALVVGTQLTLDDRGNVLVRGSKLSDSSEFRLGMGEGIWINPATLSAPRGYVQAAPAAGALGVKNLFTSPGRVFNRAHLVGCKVEGWTGKVWQVNGEELSFIEALDSLDAVNERYSKTRLVCDFDGQDITVTTRHNPDQGFKVIHVPEGTTTEVLIAALDSLPDAQAIARHLRSPGRLFINRNGKTLVDRTVI